MKLLSGCVCVAKNGAELAQRVLCQTTPTDNGYRCQCQTLACMYGQASFLGVGEMAQWLREVALAEDLDSISSTLMAAHSHL